MQPLRLDRIHSHSNPSISFEHQESPDMTSPIPRMDQDGGGRIEAYSLGPFGTFSASRISRQVFSLPW
jgi:hypothetical protein